MKIAHRIERLGTETAFAVAQAAAAWTAEGNRVYPFHLGDINIPTAPHIIEAMNKAIGDGRTGYCPGPGIPQLREALAEDIGSRRGTSVDPGNVVVMTGGKPVITKFLQVVMNPGQEVLYPNPGFPIYESQIDYLGGSAVPYQYVPTEGGFAIDIDQIRASITPNTVAIIYNDLQNPISAESTDAEREAIAQLAIENDLWVLSDEAYFETRYEGESTSISSLP
ncbi:MAG TPA: pyridoxal phosphate-dependent aminotransferase, partial [Candidatus Nesterenkonia stercoripullorum]|nr:pyridoxal phosphate-dependent aminotransferase [Candidatus Nesterenkonia stercoripullorum]